MSRQKKRGYRIYRCWAGQNAVMVPSPTEMTSLTRRGAERVAAGLNYRAQNGVWYEVRKNGVVVPHEGREA